MEADQDRTVVIVEDDPSIAELVQYVVEGELQPPLERADELVLLGQLVEESPRPAADSSMRLGMASSE